MQLSLPLMPSLEGKKTERLTIAITESQRNFLKAILKEYSNKGLTVSESEFVYHCFIHGLKEALGFLSFPNHQSIKIF